MGKSFKIGSLVGIPIKLHWSFFLVLGLAFVVYPDAGLEYQLMYSGFVLLLFLCVTLHELGHAMAARLYNVKTVDIILSPIGGVARLTRIPSKPLQEFVIAIAGPLVNVVIAGLIFLVLMYLQDEYLWDKQLRFLGQHPLFNNIDFVRDLMYINVGLVLFNLIPAFPMDGGRILRSLLSVKLSRQLATRIASIIGQIAAFVFIYIAFSSEESNFMLAIIGVFIFMAAGSEYRSVRVIETLKKYTIADVMRSAITRLHTEMTIQEAAFYLAKDDSGDFILENEFGDFKGVVLRQELSKTIKEAPSDTPIEVCLTNQYQIVTPSENFEKFFFKMHEGKVLALIVKEEESDEVLGIIDIARVNNFLRESGIVRDNLIQKWAKKRT